MRRNRRMPGRGKRVLRTICRFLYFKRKLLLCACVAALVLTAAALTAFAVELLNPHVKSLSLINIATGQPVTSGSSLPLSASLQLRYVLQDILVQTDESGTKLYFPDATAPLGLEAIDLSEDYILNLPEYLKCSSTMPDITIEAENFHVATVSYEGDHKVKLKFNENLHQHAMHSASLHINFNFTATLDSNEIGQRNSIVIPLEGGDSVTVNILENQPKDAQLKSKAGVDYNETDKCFSWTVVLDPEIPATDAQTGAPAYQGGYRFVDELGSKQTYKDGSFKITWADGTEKTPAPDTSTAGTLKYTFDADEYINEPVTITYQTEPADELFYNATSHTMVNPGSVTVPNTASLYEPGDDGAKINSKSATAKYTGKDWLVKTSGTIDRLNKTIDWTLTVNTNGRGFGNIKVYDNIDAELAYMLTSFQVTGGSTDVSPNTAFNGHGEGTVDDNLLCTIDPVNAETYVITYKTEFPNVDLLGNSNTQVSNKAWLTFEWKTGHGPGPGTDYPSPDVNKPTWLGTSIISKSGAYDRATARIRWTLTVNANRLDITGATITDQVSLTNQTGVLTDPPYAPSCTQGYTVAITPNGMDGVYTLVLKKNGTGQDNALGTDTVVVTYYTAANDPAFFAHNGEEQTFENAATIANVGVVGQTDPLGPFTSTAKPKGISRVLDKANGSYNYRTKEITWTLTVNENAMTLENAKVTDALPTYLSFVAGSDTYSASFTPNDWAAADANNVLTFDLGRITQKITIAFRTKLDVDAANLPGGFLFGKINTAADADRTLELTNEAKLTTTQYPSGTTTEPGKVEIKNMLLKKSGVASTATLGRVDYTIELNQNGADLGRTYPDGVVITDELPANLFVDPADVRLYLATVDPATGAFTRGAEVGLTFGQKRLLPPNTLQVTLPPAVEDKPCVLSYIAYVNSETDGQVSLTNKAGFGADGRTGSNETTLTASTGHGGSASSIPGKSALTIRMTDADDPTLPLPGAVYGLYAPVPGSTTGETYLFQTATTALDANGEATATFIGLTPNTTYTLKELSAPAGYVVGAPIAVTAGFALQTVHLDVYGTRPPKPVVVEIPQTGDGSMPLLWAGLMLLSVAGLCALKKRRRA